MDSGPCRSALDCQFPASGLSSRAPIPKLIRVSLLTMVGGNEHTLASVPLLKLAARNGRRKLALMDLVLLRLLFVILLAAVCYFLRPFGIQTGWEGAVAGAAAAGAVIVFELRVRALTLRRLIGAVVGSVLGIFGAALFCLVLRSAPLPARAPPCCRSSCCC